MSEKQKEKISHNLTGRFVGVKAHSYKGGWEKDGYKLHRQNGKYRREHHLVMEKAINRPLKKKEIVHHWDGNRKNNQLNNLALLRSASAHRRLHAFAERHKIPVLMLKFKQDWLIS